MKLLVQTSILLLILLSSCGLTDNRTDMVKQKLSEQITSQSEGAISLASFTKTNAIEQDLGGMKAYTVEFDAVLKIEKECWKAGNAFSGYFDNYVVRLTEPRGGWDSYDMGVPKHFAAGDQIAFKGKGILIKKENGWEVDEGSIHLQDGVFKR